jgi:gluconate 2-dehydrogenase gamma chain
MDENATSHRRLTLSAALARLVPPGAGPGAVEAGAVDYVARWLGGGLPISRFLAEGLDSLEGLALERCGAGFAALEPTRQDEVLRACESDPAPQRAGFLRQLVLLALEGSFCHPARGGNRDGAGWRFAGFGDPPLSDPSRCRAS